jgi:nucleotide-binding universal stress UspA family protein
MLTIRRVLFPTDFSTCAEGAFMHAAYLAQRTGAQLHVLHVVEGTTDDPGAWVQDLRITPEDLAADLDLPVPVAPDPAQTQPSGDAIPIIDAEERAENAAPAILDYAKAHDIDLIVMGTHGRRGVRRLLMGSVAEEVVRLSPCPVFTVGGHDSATQNWTVHRIMAPVDLSDQSVRTAHHAAALAHAYGAHLDLLYVIDEAMLSVPSFPIVGTPHVAPDEAKRRAQKTLKRHAKTLAETFPEIGEIGEIVRIGRPASEIVDFAEAEGVDLLVVGSHGRSGMQRLLMGSVADQVIRTARCPVFTVKSFGRSLLPPEVLNLPSEEAVTAGG